MKNCNGEGSVYKLRGKRRKSWVAVITTGYDERGKQLRKLIGTFITRKEAQLALISYNNNPMLFSGKTFKDVRELWFENYSKKISKVRFVNVVSALKKLSCLDEMVMTEIKLPALQRLFDNLNQSWGTKNILKAILNLIFDYALKNDFVDVNKVRFIELGKKEKVIERNIFTKQEIDILFDNIGSNKKYIEIAYMVLILIYTGMRIGELLNLKIKDVDLTNNTIQITESKTLAGIRTIPIPDKIVSLFVNNMDINKEYFITGKKNEKVSYSSFLLKFRKMLALLNLGPHTVHDTRHTFATLLNNANANETSIIKLIGHSDFNTTQNVYTHKDIEELRKAVNLLN